MHIARFDRIEIRGKEQEIISDVMDLLWFNSVIMCSDVITAAKPVISEWDCRGGLSSIWESTLTVVKYDVKICASWRIWQS